MESIAPAEPEKPAVVESSACDQALTFIELTDKALEDEITQHAANINAAHYRLLLLVAEFDRRQAWGHEGIRSCAHWLSWFCGIAIGPAREKVRVGHALAKLPKIREAFASGELSYSKARAITRVAVPGNEDCLLDFARYGSAAHVERIVRLYRRQFVGANAVMAGFQRIGLAADEDESGEPPDPAEAERQGAAHCHDHRRLTTYWDEHGCLILNARLTPEQGALVIKAIDAGVETLQEDRGFDDNPAPGNPGSNKPRHDQDINDEKREFDSASGDRHAGNRKADSLVLMAESLLQHANTTSSTADRFQVVVHVDQQVLSRQVSEATTGEPDCHIEHESAVPVETARRLCCDSKLVAVLEDGGEIVSVGRKTRAVPSSMRRALQHRDGGCTFPGCSATRFVDAHHVQHWADGGHTSMSNLILLCRHHHRLVHEGGFNVELVDGAPAFAVPDGTVIGNVPPALHSEAPIEQSTQHGWSCWGGRCDYSMAVSALHHDTSCCEADPDPDIPETFPRERLSNAEASIRV